MQFTKSTDGYLPHFKTRVLSYYDSSNSSSTASDITINANRNGQKLTIANVAKKFSIHPNTLSDWLSERKRINTSKSNDFSKAIQLDSQQQVAGTRTTIRPKSSKVPHPQFVVEFESKIIEFLQQLHEELENDLEQFTDVGDAEDACGPSSGSGYVLKFSTSFIAKTVLELFYGALAKAGDKKALLSSWMTSWCKRIYNSQYNEDKNEAQSREIQNIIPPCTSIKYSEAFKREITKFTCILGQRKTSRMFEISQRQIYDWSKLFQDTETEIDDDVPEVPVSKDSNTISKSSITQVLNYEIEQNVYNWVQSQLPRKCSSREIRQKALDLYAAQGYTSIQCSYGWYKRWCGRFKSIQKPHEDTDQPVIVWFLEQLDDNEVITYPKLQNAARTLLQSQIPTFKASLHWAYRFVKRNHQILNPNGHYSDSLPPQLRIQANACLATIDSILQLGQFTPSQICSMDEIPLKFCSPLRTEDSKSWKASLKNCEATLIIGILLNGDILPPYVIVKGQKHDESEKLCTKSSSPEVRVLYSITSEPTVSSLGKWLDLICPHNSLLLWDSYDLHSEPQITSKCIEKYITTITFPKGTSIKLQPISLFVREHILTHIYQKWKAYHAQLMNACQNNTSIIVPSADTIVEWVYETYTELNRCKDQLSNSFTECLGINKNN